MTIKIRTWMSIAKQSVQVIIVTLNLIKNAAKHGNQLSIGMTNAMSDAPKIR